MPAWPGWSVALLPPAKVEVAAQRPENEFLALSAMILSLASVEGLLYALLICKFVMERAKGLVALTVGCSGKAEMER